MFQKPNLITAIFLAVFPLAAMSQSENPTRRIRYYDRAIQFSLFPGISTNGVSTGSYFNKYSFNLFGGITAGNSHFEVGLITNSHFQSSSGFQLAGLANIIGTNAFVNLTLSEERALLHDGFEVNNHGIQVAGMLNYVLNNARGIQLAGGLNHTGNDFEGFQLAGFGNSVGGFSQGVHIAGIYNVAHKSVAGIQLSGLFNFTDEYLAGAQIALINKARYMQGRKSTPPTKARSMQIGLVNYSKSMHGTQIGILNFGGETRGKQIGLINFYRKLKSKDFADAGTPIGILNFGSTGSFLRMQYNEIFSAMIEYTTGNCQNCTWTEAGPVGMPYNENNKKFNQNALIIGIEPTTQTWGFGWGFEKVLLNKASVHPYHKLNELRMISYGARFIHLNPEWMRVEQKFNMVTRLHLEYGRKGRKFLRSTYRFAGVALNYMLADPSFHKSDFIIRSKAIASGKVLNFPATTWLGYCVGLHL